MFAYSEKFRESVLSQLKAPHNLSVPQVAYQKGISTKTLYTWIKKAREKERSMARKGNVNAENWPGREKLAVVVETASMTAYELSEYCRKKGLYTEQIKRWEEAFIQGFSSPKLDKKSKEASAKIYQLEKELKRKDKALAETAALLVLQKKLETLWEDEEK